MVICECSNESLSVGFLLSYAHENDKPVVIFIQETVQMPNLFTTLSEENNVFIVKYSTIESLKDLVKDYVELAADNVESRFNFYLPPNISNYLKYVSKKNNKSKSAFIREMLEQKMAKDQEYLN